MAEKLAKAWGKHPPGTLITTDHDEVQALGGVLVGAPRLTILAEDGFLEPHAPTEPASPAEGGAPHAD